MIDGMNERTRGNLMFEHRSESVLPRRAFWRRQLAAAGLSVSLVVVSLSLGAAGYHWLAELNWIDAYYNASMILTGMGPASHPVHDSVKVFASVYALFSAFVFLTSASLLMAPALHRMLHKLHCGTPGIR